MRGSFPADMHNYICTKFHDNWISSFRGVAMTRFFGRTDGQTDGQTDGMTALLDLLSPLATQVINNEIKTPQSETFSMCKWFIILDQFLIIPIRKLCLKTWLKWTTSHQKTYELFQVFQILHFTKSTNWCNIWSHKNTCTGVLALDIISDHIWILSKFIYQNFRIFHF